MPTKPLHPFASSPTTVLNHLNTLGISTGTITMVILYVVLAFWAIYTLVGIYHWLKYSHASSLAFPAIATHLILSFALISYMLSGNVFFLPFLP